MTYNFVDFNKLPFIEGRCAVSKEILFTYVPYIPQRCAVEASEELKNERSGYEQIVPLGCPTSRNS